MTLTRKQMIRQVGRRTRFSDRAVQVMLEALFDLWFEELAAGGRIEVEHLLVLEVRPVDRGEHVHGLPVAGRTYPTPQVIHRLTSRPSKRLRAALRKLN
jgi:nucleoid DNA-binding protein